MLNLFQHLLILKEVHPRPQPLPDPVAFIDTDQSPGDIIEAEPLRLVPWDPSE
jgi:hypothetical protein